jgi:hypothetical protein
MNNERIKVKKMPLGEYTSDGCYYAQVDGENIGVNGRTHWETEAAARLAAECFINSGEGNPSTVS